MEQKEVKSPLQSPNSYHSRDEIIARSLIYSNDLTKEIPLDKQLSSVRSLLDPQAARI
jgi:hypothetical protein